MNSMYARRRRQRVMDDLRLKTIMFWVKVGGITGILMTLLDYIANGSGE